MGRGGARPGAGRKKTGADVKSNVIKLPGQHGGARKNAGSKSKHGEPTKAMRIPQSMEQSILHYIENKGYSLPYYAMKVPMGSLAASIDYMDRMFNFNELIKHPTDTFFHPVEGDSMEPTIFAGDLAMIDRAVEPMHGDIILAMIDGGLTLKRFMKTRQRVWLEADNKAYSPIEIPADSENTICGVMLISVRPLNKRHTAPFT